MSLRKEKEILTPYRISVLLLIEKYGSLQPKFWGSETENDLSLFCNRGTDLAPKERKATCMLISNLIQGSENDINLSDLIDIIESSLISTVYTTSFITGLQELYKNGIEALHLLFDAVERFCAQDQTRIETFPCIWTSIVGLHLRQLNLAFRRLSFSNIISLYRKFKFYYEECYKSRPYIFDASSGLFMQESDCCKMSSSKTTEDSTENDVDMEESSLNTTSPYNTKRFSNGNFFLPPKEKSKNQLKFSLPSEKDGVPQSSLKTRQQAELFIQEQICLLLQQNPSAVSPEKLQEYLTNILKNYPGLGKAHFVSYLNCLRVREHAGAVHSLVKAYDSKTPFKDMNRTDDVTRTFRYAALNMAALQAQFGHADLGLTFLEESIRLAQESNDHICLQYALAWLYTLSKSQKIPLMKRSQNRCGELNLSYLTWLSLLSHTVELSRSRMPPAVVLKNLLGYLWSPSEGRNALEGSSSSQASLWGVQAGLWSLWGNAPLTAICSQLVLHMTPQVVTNLQSPSAFSPICASLCNMALILANSGEFVLSSEILQHAQSQIPSSSDHSKLWMFTQYYIAFYESLRQGMWSQAEAFAANMANVHSNYAKFLKAELHVAKGEFSEAYQLTSGLLNPNVSSHFDHLDNRIEPFVEPEIMVKCLLTEAESLAGGQNLGGALSSLIKAIALAKEFHMIYLHSLGLLQMSCVQMHLGLLKEALRSLEDGVDVVLSGGGIYDQARAKLLQAKLQVRCSIERNELEKVASSAASLDDVRNLFVRTKATQREKESVYLKARFYHACGRIDERNRSALEFRQLEERHPSAAIVVNTCVF